ncbi:MAG: hypothetical protein SGJ09_01555 [Phycisphaerae bacterium]|nr:hypothetical protein [Phycisphaerae bacterium]
MKALLALPAVPRRNDRPHEKDRVEGKLELRCWPTCVTVFVGHSPPATTRHALLSAATDTVWP